MSDRGTIAFVVASDEVCRMTDVHEGAGLWLSRGFAVDVFGLESGQYPPPRWEEDRIRFRPTRAWGTWCWQALRRLGRQAVRRLRWPAAAGAAGERVVDQPAARRDRLARVRAVLGSGVVVVDRAWLVAHAGLRLVTRPPQLIIAIDIPSVVLARLVHAVRSTPYVYQPRELTCGWDVRGLAQQVTKRLERCGHRAASLTFTYDELRGELLARDNGIDPAAVRVVPNAPMGVCTTELRDRWQWPFELPAGTKTVLYAGSVIREHMVAEIIDSVTGWPPGVVLVVHGRIARDYRAEIESSASRVPGRVFFSETIVPEGDLDLLYASADIGVAFYRPVSDNFRFVGKAAGKIFHWMKVGVPVVVNDLPGMRTWIEGDGVGLAVDDPAVLGDAVERLIGGGAALRDHCRRTFARYEFGSRYGALVDRTIRELALGPQALDPRPDPADAA